MTLRVLYVDDEMDIRMIVEFALEDEADMEIQLCASGQEALATITDYQPDIILLDVMMPSMDGPETLQQLRKHDHLKHTPIAFVTAKVQPQEVQHLKALGAAAVIAKPFDIMKLAEKIRLIWKESQHA